MSCGLAEGSSAGFGGAIVSLRLIFNCAGVDRSGTLSPDNLFDLLGCCETSGDKKVFRLRFVWAGSEGSGGGSDSIAGFGCGCFERVRLKRKPLSSSSYAITGLEMKLDELAHVAVGRRIPRYSTYMASSFDHPHQLYDRSLGSFPLRQSSDALQEARLHRQMHFARFSDVPAAARIPC